MVQYELVQKLGLLWEGRAAILDAESIIDNTQLQDMRVDASRPAGKEFVVALTIRRLKGGNPHAQVEIGEEVQIWLESTADWSETGRVTKALMNRRLSMTIKLPDYHPAGTILKCHIRLMANHLPLRRKLQGISAVVQDTVDGSKSFSTRNTILGIRRKDKVMIRDVIPDEAWNELNESTYGFWHLNNAQLSIFDALFTFGLENGLCLMQSPPGT